MEFLVETKTIESVNKFIGASSDVAVNMVLGGYGANYVVGGVTLHQIRSNMLEWKFLPKNTMMAKRIQTANEILNLPKFIDNPKTLCAIIREIYNLSDEDLLSTLSKSLGIKVSLEIALRKLYYVWRDLIELTLVLLLKNNEVNVPKGSEILTNINIIEFQKSPKLKDISEKLRTYEHKGYCPHEPIVRILHLFTFPLQEVVTLLKKDNPEIFFSVDLVSAYKKIEQIIKQINVHKHPLKFKKDNNFSDNDGLDACMERFLTLYRQTYPALEEREQNYISAAQKITEICNIVEDMVVNIIK